MNHPLKSFYIETYGCQMNVHDSERIVAILQRRGLKPVEGPEEADLVLVNTCSVREKAEQKVFSQLGLFALMKRKRPHMVVGVAGCIAQEEKGRLFDRFPSLDIVIGTRSIPRLWEVIEEATSTGTQVASTSPRGANSEIVPGLEDRSSSVRAWVTIMEGCDKFCSFCIVPYTRGREISRPVAEIVEEVRFLAASGYKEVALLGQNVNSYGKKFGDDTDFGTLLRAVHAEEGIERIRFFTSHPQDCSASMIAAMAECPKVCPYLHLPVQSGSTALLKAMRRNYSRKDYVAKIAALREALPGLALSTDFIAGFPGETEADFQETLSLIREVEYDMVFAFPYSPRQFTTAFELPDNVPPEVKSERLTELFAVQRPIGLKKNEALVGKTVEVLVDGTSAKDESTMSGRTPCYRVVNLVGSSPEIGDLVKAAVLEAHPHSLMGQILPIASASPFAA